MHYIRSDCARPRAVVCLSTSAKHPGYVALQLCWVSVAGNCAADVGVLQHVIQAWHPGPAGVPPAACMALIETDKSLARHQVRYVQCIFHGVVPEAVICCNMVACWCVLITEQA